MTRRGKRRKGYRPPGTYKEPDGSTTIIVREGDQIIKTNIKNVSRSVLDAAAAHDMATVRAQTPRESIGPSVRTNPIPGLPSRLKKDYATGESFESRGEYENYLKANHLVEMSAGDLGQAPSKSTRTPPTYTRNLPVTKDGKFEMPTTVTPQTLMSGETHQRLFGGQAPAQVNIRVGK